MDEGRGVEKWAKKKFRFIAVVTVFSLLFSYYSGLSNYNIQFSSLILSLFAHAIDRKYVFLICNGILALLLNNFSFIKSAEDAVSVEENVAYGISPVKEEEETDHQNEYGYVGGDQELLEEEGEEGEEMIENTTVEEVNDGSVSTEELNQKFEEFIRKKKEEIRVEAQQHL